MQVDVTAVSHTTLPQASLAKMKGSFNRCNSRWTIHSPVWSQMWAIHSQWVMAVFRSFPGPPKNIPIYRQSSPETWSWFDDHFLPASFSMVTTYSSQMYVNKGITYLYCVEENVHNESDILTWTSLSLSYWGTVVPASSFRSWRSGVFTDE